MTLACLVTWLTDHADARTPRTLVRHLREPREVVVPRADNAAPPPPFPPQEREKYVFWAPWTGTFNRWMIVRGRAVGRGCRARRRAPARRTARAAPLTPPPPPTPPTPPAQVLPVLAVQIAIGSMYSWSIFNAALDKVWGTPGTNTNAFLVSIACFGLTTLFFGTWVERNGPFKAVCVTLFLTPAGWALASLGSYRADFGIEVLYGLAHGVGTGFGARAPRGVSARRAGRRRTRRRWTRRPRHAPPGARPRTQSHPALPRAAYIAVTSALQRWFCEFKGLATGIAVMGFGFGSFIWCVAPTAPAARRPSRTRGVPHEPLPAPRPPNPPKDHVWQEPHDPRRDKPVRHRAARRAPGAGHLCRDLLRPHLARAALPARAAAGLRADDGAVQGRAVRARLPRARARDQVGLGARDDARVHVPRGRLDAGDGARRLRLLLLRDHGPRAWAPARPAAGSIPPPPSPPDTPRPRPPLAPTRSSSQARRTWFKTRSSSRRRRPRPSPRT